MGLNGKAHAGAVTDEWSEIETERFFGKLLLSADGMGEDNKKERRAANTRIGCSRSQSPSPSGRQDDSTRTSLM